MILIFMPTWSSNAEIYQPSQNFLSKKVTVHSVLALLVKQLGFECLPLGMLAKLQKYIIFLCDRLPTILHLKVLFGIPPVSPCAPIDVLKLNWPKLKLLPLEHQGRHLRKSTVLMAGVSYHFYPPCLLHQHLVTS